MSVLFTFIVYLFKKMYHSHQFLLQSPILIGFVINNNLLISLIISQDQKMNARERLASNNDLEINIITYLQ